MNNDEADLLFQAKKYISENTIPMWTTHIAVSKVRDKVEPCHYSEEACDFLDDNPLNFNLGEWAGSYVSKYWEFFSLSEVKK